MSFVLLGEILALFAALCGAASSVIYSILGKRVDSDCIAFIRMFIALPIMFAFVFIAEGPEIFSCRIQDVSVLILSGFVGFFVTDLFLFRAYALWGAEETMVVMCLAPMISTVLSFLFFGERLNLFQIFGVILIACGIAMTVSSDKKNNAKVLSIGVVYAFLAAVLQACADMITKRGVGTLPLFGASAMRSIGGVIGWLIFAAVRGKKLFSSSVEFKKSPSLLLLLFCGVLIGTAIGTISATASIKFAPAGIVTSLKQISPVFILPFDVFVLKKKTSVWAVLGTFATAVGVFLLF